MRNSTGPRLIFLTFALLLVGCKKTPPDFVGNYSSTSVIGSSGSISQNTQHYQLSENNNSKMISFGYNSSRMGPKATREPNQVAQNPQLNSSKNIAQIDWTKVGNYVFDDLSQTGVRWLLITGGQK